MRTLPRFVCALLCGALLVAGVAARAAEAKASDRPPQIASEIASAVTQITGIAISPLFGMGAVGAYKWFKAGDAASRQRLPWFARPWFWAPALLLVAACFTKDSLGTMVPTALKKPLDVAEVFENKLSGLVATGAIVPLAIMIFKSDVTQGAWLQGPGFAVIDMGQVAGYFMVPVALAVYAVVWVVSHTINILILISPFATVDAALKAFRATVLASVVGSHWFSDTLGLLWAGVLVFICLMLAGWAFRLMVFGHEFAWDLLTFRRKRFSPSSGVHWCFLARRIGRVPVRTYGKLERAGGDALKFTYRPFLVLPPRTVEIPGRSLGIGRGMLHPEVLRVEGEEVSDIFDLPPRYSGHEQVVAGALGITEIRDVGLRAAWSWLKGLLGGRSAA